MNQIDVTTHGGIMNVRYEYKGYLIIYSMVTGPTVIKEEDGQRKIAFTKHGAGFRDLDHCRRAIDEGDIDLI